MKKFFLASLISGVLMSSIVGTASATQVNYDFESSTFQSLYSQGYYDSIVWPVGGTTVTVTAHEVINDNNGDLIGSGIGSPVNDGVWVDHQTDGLGAESYSSDSDKQTDGSSSTTITTSGVVQYIHDDGLLFSFASEVELIFVNLGRFGSNDDFNLTVDGVKYLEDFDDLGHSVYVSSIVDDDKYNFTGVTGKEFLIWADGSSDEFLIDEIRINTAPVPEPATILLLGTGLAGLAFWRRKRG